MEYIGNMLGMFVCNSLMAENCISQAHKTNYSTYFIIISWCSHKATSIMTTLSFETIPCMARWSIETLSAMVRGSRGAKYGQMNSLDNLIPARHINIQCQCWHKGCGKIFPINLETTHNLPVLKSQFVITCMSDRISDETLLKTLI